MTTIDAPEWFTTASMEWLFDRDVSQFASATFVQAVDLLAWGWRVRVTFPPDAPALAGRLSALTKAMAGGVLRLRLHNRYRPEPLGSMRGSPVLANPATQFSDTLEIQATPGATLLSGDLIGIGGQLFEVFGDAVANGSGVMAAKVLNRTRVSLSTGAAVVWDKPTAAFILPERSVATRYSPNMAETGAIELMESP